LIHYERSLIGYEQFCERQAQAGFSAKAVFPRRLR
jgi:hypothetical protein